ncbi:MAG: threonine synthase [candidate division WOR-3 bacterium]|nr:MAG: threonine synthase [candidate division WOR-3 bacterium]
MKYVRYLQCSMCGKRVDSNHLWNRCRFCGKPLIVLYDLNRIRKAVTQKDIARRPPDIWRYRELLPVQDSDNILSLGEGFTPLLHAASLGHTLGFRRLYIKDEGQNPTGSFKARGLSVAISRARELGVKQVSIPSAGNAAAALSAYAALGGLKAFVYMPRDVPKVFVIECIAMGAQVQLIDGLITDCSQKASLDAYRFGRFDVSTLNEPYRIEGKKTMGFEIAEQMRWKLPDIIIYPTGGGTGLIGMWKAFEEMEKLGWIGPKRPRMVTVQAEGCAPIVKAFKEGKDFAEPWHEATTIADGLRVPSAIGDFLILQALRESHGTAVAVSDDEIMDAITLISRTQGVFVCPEGAATLAAFRRLRELDWIKDNETVVLFNTASGLKYVHLWAKELKAES